MGLLNFVDINKTYLNKDVLRGVTFSVEKGDRLALVGPNGSGKTTLVRIAMEKETADHGSVTMARGIKAGFLTQDLSGIEGEKNAVNWRRIDRLTDRMREIEEAMASDYSNAELLREYDRVISEYEMLDGYSVESRLKAILYGLGLKRQALYTPLEKLSSGEKMRAALARILLEEPDLLVLDEPTNHLDVPAVEWLESFLMSFSGGVMIISHDRYFLDRVATRVIELRGGTAYGAKGNYTTFIQQQKIRRDHILLESRNLDKRIRDEKELARQLRAKSKVSAAKSREKAVERMQKEKKKLKSMRQDEHLWGENNTKLNLGNNVHLSSEIAFAENARKSYDGMTLFDKVSFLIRGGEKVGIIGANGCGKTTLINMLLGIDEDFSGKCAIGHWVKFGFLDQDTSFDDDSLTMYDEVKGTDDMMEVKVRGYLSRVGFFGDDVYKRIEILSGGEKVRLRLACLLRDEPYCLVLDEPTNHLDLNAREAVERAIRSYGGSVIAVSHDRYYLNNCVSRILSFEDGSLISYDGNWDYYKAKKENKKITEIKPAVKKLKKKKNIVSKDIQNDIVDIKSLEHEIEGLENELNNLENEMNKGYDYKLSMKYEEIERKLSKLYIEWEETHLN